MNGAGRPALVVDFLGLDNLFYKAYLIILIENREIRLQAHQFRMTPQNPGRNRMKRTDPQTFGRTADHCSDPVAHFAGGLIGERDGENLARPGAARHKDMTNAGRQNAGFACSGAGQNQQRAIHGFDGFLLGAVQTLKVGRRRCGRDIE